MLFIFAQTIYITQFVEHAAFTETLKGIKSVLKGFAVKVESAQGNVVLATQIASKFINQNPDAVIALGTISAQTFIKYQNKSVPIFFSSVTDPKGAGLSGMMGVSNFIDLKPQIELFKKLQPQLKRLGFLYNPGEANSVTLIKKLKPICQSLEIKLIEQAIFKTSDIPIATKKLLSQTDAIFISNDNTALSALSNIIKIANEFRTPVYVSDTDAVKLGATAALGPNQYEIGVQTGKMVLRYLRTRKIQPIEYPTTVNTVINKIPLL